MKKFIEQLRQSVNSSNWPLNIKDWPDNLNIYTNCLAFACGFAFPDFDDNIFIPPKHISISEYVENLFIFSGISYKKIASIDEAKENEIIILVYDIPNYDFHVIRRNADKTWVHKVGWIYEPEYIHDLDSLEADYPSQYIASVFAVNKRVS